MLLAVAGLAIAAPPASADGAIVDSAGCSTSTLAPNDDGSTGAISLPFTVNFFGEIHNSLFVNNNGNVTFGSSLGTFTPDGLTTAINRQIIAPFWGDVDTRGTGSVRYGPTTVSGAPAFCVVWDGVGYYSHGTDKTNTFQLLLVDASGPGDPGDIDIWFNYDQVQWETGGASGGSGGLGGTPARAGYTKGTGDPGTFFELAGSGESGAFLDNLIGTSDPNPSALSRTSNEPFTLLPGQNIFRVRQGGLPTGGSIEGEVQNAAGTGIAGAPVSACQGSVCRNTVSNGDGGYVLDAVAPGQWVLTAWPPAGSSLLMQSIGPVDVVINQATTEGTTFQLTGPTPPPPGTSVTGGNGTTGNGLPSIFLGTAFNVTTTGCEGATGTFEIIRSAVVATGPLVEGPPGFYTGSVPGLSPGEAHVRMSLDCPEGEDPQVDFDIYIDPAGHVRNTAGDPLPGATVTLYRSDVAEGPFTVVPDQSAIMSPANRDNPDQTDATGYFSWLTVPGFYKVRAEMAGCTGPGGATFVETEVLPVPPEHLNLDLRLDCGDTTPPPPVNVAMCDGLVATIVAVAGQATSGTGAADVIVGTAGADRINGLAGDDVICGGGGKDVIDPGGGDDRVFGQGGDDYVYASYGRDVIDGGAHNDRLWGGPGDNVLVGGPGNDQLVGGGNVDVMNGGDGTDSLSGGAGNDTLAGDAGRDTCRGGAGTNTIDPSCER